MAQACCNPTPYSGTAAGSTTREYSRHPSAPSVRPVRISDGATSRRLAAVATATAGVAPATTTNTTAFSVIPSHTIASGSHAIGGSASSPTISVPTLRWTTFDAAIAIPTGVPTTTATTRPTNSRSRLRWAATSSPFGPPKCETRADQTLAGVGRSTVLQMPVAESAPQTTTTSARIATLGQI